MGRRFAFVLLAVSVLSGSRADYLAVQRKFQQIEKHQVRPGQRVPITAQELNAYVEAELPKVAPPGVRRPSVALLGNNRASGAALIDFVRLRSAQGKPPGWVVRKLLEGEHEVQVTARIRSFGGKAQVDVESVQVAGLPISGAALDFLIQNYLLPNYPEAKIGKPFELRKGVDRIEVAPGMAYVIMR